MFGTVLRQFSHVKVARKSSGRTSEVRVTVPEIETSWPIFCVLRCRIRDTRGKL